MARSGNGLTVREVDTETTGLDPLETAIASSDRSPAAAAISAFSCGRPSRRPDTATSQERGGGGALAEQCEIVTAWHNKNDPPLLSGKSPVRFGGSGC
jgi:hypothetical protein